MTRSKTVAKALLILGLFLLGISLGMTAANAQEQTPTETPTDSPVDEVVDEATGDDEQAQNATQEPEDPEENKYAREINPSVKLVRADFSQGEVELVLHSTIPGISVALTDMGQSASNIDAARGSGGGSYDLTFRQTTLDKGYNTITLPITRYEGLAAVAITSGGEGIQVVEYVDNSWFPATFDSGETRLVGAAGVTIGAVLVVLLIRRSRKKLEGAVQEL